MSTEQSEGETVNSQADITQQATTPTPTTHIKNPKRVAAGKKGAEKKTQIVREKQKALDDAYVEIEKYKAKAAAAAPTTEVESPKNGGLSANQWIGIGGIVVGLLGIYYKREELKAAFKKNPPEPAPAIVEPAPQRKGGVRHMD